MSSCIYEYTLRYRFTIIMKNSIEFMDISFLFKLGYYMLKLIYYVPETHLESTKSAIFNAGGGGIGNYEHCAWQVLGIGQFKPVKAAHPFMGQLDVLEKVSEWRVEIIVAEDKARDVARALKQTHPYEEPAFEFIQTVDIND